MGGVKGQGGGRRGILVVHSTINNLSRLARFVDFHLRGNIHQFVGIITFKRHVRPPFSRSFYRQYIIFTSKSKGLMMMVFHFLRSIALFLTVGSIAVTLPTCHASNTNTNNDVEGCDSSSSNNRHYLKGPHEVLPLEDERVTTGNTDQAQDEDSSRHHHRVMEEEVITPSIVGGTEVSPRRKYPVSRYQ